MKLNQTALQSRTAWESMHVRVPNFDVTAVREATQKAPIWVHFGAGNLFRAHIARLQQTLLEKNCADRGIIALDTSDGDLVRRVYHPHDNLSLLVTLHADARADYDVLASVSEAIHADFSNEAALARMHELFAQPSLQMVSFTVTEKGYALRDAQGNLLPEVCADAENGPDHAHHVMSRAAALLLARWQNGAEPIAMVSMDNCSANGEKLRAAILEIADLWVKNGFAPESFAEYVADESRVAFPWTMIDKITPRPDAQIAASLKRLGLEEMDILPRQKGAAIAPFVNAESAEYLVIEDRFPNGRPALEKAGAFLTDRETVRRAERMKVTVCLNPLHTALATLGCVLGYTRICDEMRDETLVSLIRRIGAEGLPVAEHPGVIEPQAFIEELLTERLPNPAIPDTPQRIACDTSQKVPIRYGETIKAYLARPDLDLASLVGIPLAIAGWLRYLLGVDDEMQPMECSPDPRLDALQEALSSVRVGAPESFSNQLSPILSDATLFGCDLMQTPLAEKITAYFAAMLGGKGAVRACLAKVLKEQEE